MKIIDCLQGSTEWALARAGVVTASEIDDLVSPTLKLREGETPKKYLYAKLAERIMGYKEDAMGSGGTFPMQNGSILEKVALPWYEFTHNVSVKRVGFITTQDGKIGCSPDGLIEGRQCGLEIKCPMAATHLKYLLGGGVPAEYVTQVQFSMFVTGYAEWVFVSYNPNLPPFIVHTVRNLEAMKAFEAALKPFLANLDDAEQRVRAMLEVRNKHAQEQGRAG
jgi:hypothetical protein